jgi:hypothetical protein
MRRILITLALIAPFFSQAGLVIDPSSPSFILNGTADVQYPETTEYTIVDCKIGETIEVDTLNPSYDVMVSACRNLWAKTITERANWCGTISWTGDLEATYNFAKYGTNCEGEKLEGVSSFYPPSPLEDGQSKGCPPEGMPEYIYPVYVGEPSNDNLRGCAKPSELNLLDSCDVSSGNEVLGHAVDPDKPNVCISMPDGSVCEYNAVDAGSSQVYMMDLEGDCYTGTGTPTSDIGSPFGQEFDLPDYNYSMGDFQCMDNGGLLSCAESADFQPDDNSNAKCGTVNGQNYCFDDDTDGDSLPDYLDPDIDGDGIANGDDLDANGDGQDDATRPDSGSSSGSGSGDGGVTNVNVEIDLQPVVNELKKMNETNVQTDGIPTEGLESFWVSDYEEGFQGVLTEKIDEIKGTQLFGFVEQFRPSALGGSAANYNFCFNLGSMGNFGCHELGIDPRVIPAIKILILISAGFMCRRLIFGG